MLNRLLSPAPMLSRLRDTFVPQARPDIGPVDPNKPRVLYFVTKYPEFSETYIHEEMVSATRDYNVKIIDYEPTHDARERALPHIYMKYVDSNLAYGSFNNIDTEFTGSTQQRFLDRVSAVVEEYQPHVMHGHYFPNVWLMRALADRHGIPFTIRGHSFDMLNIEPEKMKSMMDAANTPLCLKVFVFPEFRQTAIDHGIDPAKVESYWPIVAVDKFYDETPRPLTKQVMTAGPCTPKKAHSDIVDLAALMQGSGYRFNLYAKGHWLKKVQRYNEEKGRLINFTYEDPERMPAVYKQHDWLVYPSHTKIGKVGLPVAVIEAQASGIGVCLQELPGRRQAQLDFLGGAGFLFKSVDELPAILSQPYPEEMRQAGFINARKCDLPIHQKMLDDAWASAVQPRMAT